MKLSYICVHAVGVPFKKIAPGFVAASMTGTGHGYQIAIEPTTTPLIGVLWGQLLEVLKLHPINRRITDAMPKDRSVLVDQVGRDFYWGGEVVYRAITNDKGTPEGGALCRTEFLMEAWHSGWMVTRVMFTDQFTFCDDCSCTEACASKGGCDTSPSRDEDELRALEADADAEMGDEREPHY